MINLKSLSITIVITLVATSLFAQQLTLTQFTKAKIDSLKKTGADAIIWYKSYCGECEIMHPPGYRDTLPHGNYCIVDVAGYTLTDNLLIYYQHNIFFELIFDCQNLSRKVKLDSCRSVPYFISILPILNRRDKAKESNNPLQSDGSFEEATLYLKKSKQYVSMADGEKRNDYKLYKRYSWSYKKIKLLALIEKDIQPKK